MNVEPALIGVTGAFPAVTARPEKAQK